MHEFWITLTHAELVDLMMGRLKRDDLEILRRCNGVQFVSWSDMPDGGVVNLVFKYEDKRAGVPKISSGPPNSGDK